MTSKKNKATRTMREELSLNNGTKDTKMTKYSTSIQTLILTILLTINGIAHAEKPDAMPQSTYDAIINQVIADYSYYNANAVVEGVSQWLLDQPLPVTDGELIQSGNCTNCTATTLSAATGFKQPRKVKVKAKLRANGTFPSVLKIKWNRPKPLDASIINDYEVSHYLIYISKDNQSYEILRKDAKYKANGKPKQKQRIRFKDRTTGNYQVQVSAVYRSTSIRGNDKNSTAQSKASNNKDGEDENSSSWTPPENFITITDPTTVGELSGAIKVCLNANNYPDTKVLLSINKDLYCSNYNLQDSDIDQLQLLSNIRAIDISNNPDITDISGLANLIYLSHLRLSDNPNISIPDFSGLTALRNLYMENMGLTAVPSLSSNDNLRVLDMSGNQIISGFENLPSNLTVIELDNNQNSNTCLDLVASGKEYEIVNISANNNDLSDCVGVSGIKYLNVIGGNFPIIGGLSREVNQDVSAFTTGLCGLNITSTNLTHLKGNAPFVAGLSLINNTDLQQVSPYKYTVLNSTFLPNVLTITEDDNKLLCSNRYAIAEFAPTNTVNQNSTLKQKSLIAPKAAIISCVLPQSSYFNIPDSCSPDPLSSITVLRDIATFISWTKDPTHDYSLWNVISYEIKGYDFFNNVIESYQVSTSNELSLLINNINSLKYTVSACTANKCGKEITSNGVTNITSSVSSFAVHQDINSQRRFIQWTKNIDFDFTQWNISRFQIIGYANNEITYIKNVSISAESFLVDDILTTDRYTISACNQDICGVVLEDTVFDQGLTRVIEPSVIWDTNTTNFSYHFKFKYPQGVFDHTFGQPDRFIITPDFIQPSGNPTEIIVTVGNINNNNADSFWHSVDTLENKFVGTNFTIKACSDALGCGAGTSVVLGNPLTDANLPIPSWTDSSAVDIWAGTEIALNWNGAALNEKIVDTDIFLVDYLEITEHQPVIRTDQDFGSAPKQTQVVIYYVNRGLDNVFKSQELLSRVNKGEYFFTLKACHRDRLSGDTCSDSSIQVNKTLHRGEIVSAPSTPTGINFVDIVENGNILSKTLAWDKVATGTKPDYYFVGGGITQGPLPGVPPICNQGSAAFAVDYDVLSNVSVSLNGGTQAAMFTGANFCSDISDSNIIGWSVKGCYNGLGCGEMDTILANQPSIGTITVPNNTNNPSSAGGPGDLNPGSWWNPKQTGTGWHFYWASELRYPSMHEDYGNTYDLLGVWHTFKLKNEVWTPTWIFSQLKLTQNSLGNEFYEGNLQYVTRVINVSESRSIGRLQVYFDNSTDNNFVKLNIDVEAENGIITKGFTNEPVNGCLDASAPGINLCLSSGFDDSINIPLINFDKEVESDPEIYGEYGSDIDHYSGMWWNTTNGAINGDFIFLIDINHNLEWTSVLFYDDLGDPIWVTSTNCSGSPCSTPQAGSISNQYTTIKSGFNPLAYSNLVFGVGSGTTTSAGIATRRLTHGGFKDGILTANLNIQSGENTLPGRGTGAHLSVSGSSIFLSKAASFHDIRFFINGHDETVTTCDPNDINSPKECVIKFTWFTDDDFISIEPYYSLDGGTYEKLEVICPNVPLGSYVTTQFECTMPTAGNYTFQLHKDKYVGPGTVAIAESQQLTIIACEGDCPSPNDPPPVPEGLVSSSQQSFIGPDTTGNNNGILELSDLPNAPSTSTTVGSTKGSFNVTPNGAASYSIPIAASAASGGMTPSISLNYNSQASRSSMGKGWSIGGYSVINRCPQTYDQDFDASTNDPLIMSVNFSSTDKFCVDGKRLLLKSGVYGEDGAVYETELNNFTQYTSTGAQGGGPQCFTAQHKNGNTSYYGNCGLNSNEESTAYIDSGLTAITANNPAFAWAQSRVIDVSGNYYDFAYYSGVVPGFSEPTIEFYPKKVYYSGNTTAGQISQNNIEFIYEATLPISKIIGNVISTNPRIKLLLNNKQLIRIDSKSNNDFLRSYKLGYKGAANNWVTDSAGNNLLTSIQECTDSSLNTCFDATIFSWEDSVSNSIGSTNLVTPLQELPSIYLAGDGQLGKDFQVNTLDANGDGLKDFAISYPISANTLTRKIALTRADGNGFDIINPIVVSRRSDGRDKVDINGDGFTDIIKNKNVYLWNGSGYDAPFLLNGLDGYNIKKYFDLDGDGLPEAIAESVVDDNRVFEIFKNNMGLDPSHTVANIYNNPPKIFVMNIDDLEYYDGGAEIIDVDPFEIKEISSFFDSNGDGISEILIRGGYTVCADENSSVGPCSVGSPFEIDQWAVATLEQNNNQWIYKITSLAPTESCASIALCGFGISQPTFIDLNNDGSMEMCYVQIHADGPDVTKQWRCTDKIPTHMSNNEPSIFSKVFDERDDNEYLRQIEYQDYNGDGNIDLLYSDGQSGGAVWSVIYTGTFNGEVAISNSSIITDIIAGNADVDPSHPGRFYQIDRNQFMDINNDGLMDHIIFRVDENDNNKIKIYQSLGQSNSSNIAAKDKITSFSEALGNHYTVNYKRMSDTSVYTRDNNSLNAWFGQGNTPVYDFNSQMSIVAHYESELPAYDIANINLSGNSTVEQVDTLAFDYHYYGGKIQAGGRGFLGFKTVETFDVNNRTLMQSSYHQEFPFTGQSYEVLRYLLDFTSSPTILRAATTQDKSIPCWVNNNCEPVIPEPDNCLTKLGIVCAPANRSAVPVGSKLISSVYSQWQKQEVSIGTKTSVFTYPEFITTDQFELDGISRIGRTLVATTFDETSFYGNPTQIVEYTYGQDNFSTAIQTKTTTLDYYYYTSGNQYVVDRTKSKTETYSRPGAIYQDQVRKTAYTYDSKRLLLTEKQTSGTNTSNYLQRNFLNRDSFGNSLQTSLSSNSATTRTAEKSYDSQGRYITSEKQDNQVLQKVLSRDKFGNPTTIENQQGIRAFSSYDAMGRLFYQIDDLGGWSQIQYSRGSGLNCPSETAYYTTTESIGPTSWQCFDQLDREIRTLTQGFGATEKIYIDSHYDISGRLIEKSIPKFSVPSITEANDWQRNAYDELGRVIKTRDANGSISNSLYTPLTLRVTNALNQSTTTAQNMLGEITSVTDANDNTITYEYDDKGNQVSVDGPLSGFSDKIITSYNAFDQVQSIDDPDLGIWSYEYNLFGELLYQRDANNNCTVMTYDNLGRMTSRKYWENASTNCLTGNNAGQSNWYYDNTQGSSRYGLLYKEQNNKLENNYFYDELARLETTITTIYNAATDGSDLTYTQDSFYDQYGRALAQYDATGDSIRLEYNSNGYQDKTIDQLSGIVFSTIQNLDAFGNIKKVKAGNEVTTNNYYDQLGRVTSISTKHQSVNIQNLNYVYDTVGNLKSREDARDSNNVFYEEFNYDPLSRLKTVKAQTNNTPLTQTMAFAYDNGGRITNFNGKGYHYSSGPVHGVNSIGVKNFIYDNNGNQIQSDDRTLEYSAFNKTKRMYRNTTSVEFEYDNNNNRYKRTDVGLDENETTYYVGNVEFITKDNGEVINKRYIGDTVISHYLNTQIKEIKYLHKDHLGSIQSVTDQSYNSLTTSHLSYDAYGRRRDAGNNTTVLDQNPIADVTKRGFTGQEHVDQLGIINYNARLYDPELGIMLQADTIIPDGPVTQSMNRYSYVFNNPLSYTDPTGHSPDWFANRAMPSSDFIEETTVAVQRDRSGRRIFNDSAQKSGSGATVEGINDATVGSPGGYQGNGLGGDDEFTGIVPHDDFTDNSFDHPFDSSERRYNPDDPTYHHYDVYSQGFCDWGASNCTAEIRDDVLSKFSRPTLRLAPENAVGPGEVTNAYYSGLIGDVNNPDDFTKIIGQIYQEKLGPGIYRNITIEGHQMHPGEIIRKWVNINGKAHIMTHGVGLNKSLLRYGGNNNIPSTLYSGSTNAASFFNQKLEKFKASKNDKLGPKAFQTMDRQAYKYWSNTYDNQ